MRLLMTSLMCTVLTGSAVSQTATPTAPITAAATDGKVTAVRSILYLRTDLSSSSAKAGKETKADLAQTVTLPGGVVLPKGTTFKGTVLDVSKHSKEKPNGTMLLEFNKAFPKGKDPVNVVVRIEKLAPEDNTGAAALPNSNGGMISMAANSGGGGNSIKTPTASPDKSNTGQLGFELNDRSDMSYKESSTIDGVYVAAGSSGSGMIFSFHDDCYLDGSVKLTVLIAPAPAGK